MVYESTDLGRAFTTHLTRGEDILLALKEFAAAQGIRRGVVLTGYGTVDRCCYRQAASAPGPDDNHLKVVEGPLEILSISGRIVSGLVDCQIVVADRDKAMGGRLEEGSRVLYLCNLVIAEFAG